MRTAICEAVGRAPDPFAELVDLADRLEIDAVSLVTATIETELMRRDPTLRLPGRPALDSTDALYLLETLDRFRRAAEAAASSNDPVEAALALLPADRDVAVQLAAKIPKRGRAALSVALEVLRDYEPDLVQVFVGKRTATEARKRLKVLATRGLETASDARWLAVKARATEMIRSASKG